MQILVEPHAGRWAVREAPGATPVAEYDTCELAEAAARDFARERGAEVVVSREELGTPSAAREVHVEDRDPAEKPSAGGIPHRAGDTGGDEMLRERQAGL